MIKKLQKAAARLLSVNKFRNQFLPEIPADFQPAFKLVYFHTLDLTDEEKALGQRIESFRKQIPAEHGRDAIRSYKSPRANTFEFDEASGHARPGDVNDSSVEATLRTGSDIYKGILLKRIVEGAGCSRILELGTNTGFSGAYFVSGGNTHLTSVEGSDELCTIARKNISRVSDNFTVVNALFDDAIDDLAGAGATFDAVFIDGQHEEEATLHYARRVAPLMAEGALFIFDDIYWSRGMNNAWQQLLDDFGFAEGADLFTVGLLRGKSSGKPVVYDLGEVLPRPEFSRGDW